MTKPRRKRPKVTWGETILEVRVVRRKTTHSRDVVLRGNSWEHLAGPGAQRPRGGIILFSSRIHDTVVYRSPEMTWHRIRETLAMTMIGLSRDRDREISFVLGHLFAGRHRSPRTGHVYDEGSYCAQVHGVDRDEIERIADDLRDSFCQREVMVLGWPGEPSFYVSGE